MFDLDEIKLSDVMPDSLSRDKDTANVVVAVDEFLREAAGLVETPAHYVAIDSLSSTALDHLAAQYDVSVWRDTWSLTLKRSVLKTAIQDKRMKGSVAAVKQALASVSSIAIIKEWWELSPKGTPHTFSVIASQSAVDDTFSAEMQEDIAALIDEAKPFRSHYTLSIQNNLSTTLSLSGHVRSAAVSQIVPGINKTSKVATEFGVMAAVRAIARRHIIFE